MELLQPTQEATHTTEWHAGAYLLRLFCITILPSMIAIELITFVISRSGGALTAAQIAGMQSKNPELAWAGPLQLYSAIKLARVKMDKPDIIVIGASRGGQIRSAMFKPYRFYNANMVGWSFDRLYTILDDISRNDPPKIVIFNLDYFMFGSDYETRWRKTEDIMPLSYGTVETTLEGMKVLDQSLKIAPLRTIAKLKDGTFSVPDPPDDRLDGLKLFGPSSRNTAISAFRHDGSMLYFPSFLSQSAMATRQFTTVLAQVDSGTGERIDPDQIMRLQKLAALAHERGIVLVGIQLPLPGDIVSVLDGDEDYVENQQTFRARDRQVWKEFETDRTRKLLRDMGIAFFDFVSLPEAKDSHLFVDNAHPGEYLVLASMIELIKDPYIRSMLPKVDIDKLKSVKNAAEADQNYFDIFRSDF